MSDNFNSNTENKDEWLTPPELVYSLGKFDLDPCQPINPPFFHAYKGYNKHQNGLEQLWMGRIWCNPPYGRETYKWIKRLADHGNGIALIFARTDTKGFHREIFNKADAIFFFSRRIRFYHVDGQKGGPANAPSCLVAFGENNVEAIKNSKLEGKLVRLT